MLLAIVGSPVFGAALDPSDVIAESARARLTIGDYQAEVAKLPGSLRAEFAANPLRLRQYLDNLYMLRVLAADARAQGLEKDPVLARQIALQVDRMLAQARVDRIEAAAAADFDRNSETYVARARELYLVNRDQYAVPERVRAAHILIKVVDGDRDAALRKAETIRAQAVAPGADFTKLAREFSDDPKAATNGGELGYFAASAMDPAFAAAAFALQKPGDISVPVLSKFGYHIIRLEDRRPATIRTFDEMKPELARTTQEEGGGRCARSGTASDFLRSHAQGERRAHRADQFGSGGGKRVRNCGPRPIFVRRTEMTSDRLRDIHG